MEMPPVSKQTPLPTKHTGLARLDLPPFHCITTTREGRALPWPTASRAFIFSASSCSSSRISTVTPASARSRMRSANSTGPRMLAGSLTRSRARKTPSATALRAAYAFAAASGLEQWTVKVCSPLRASVRLVVLILAGSIFLEVVAPQDGPQRQIRCKCVRPGLAKIGRLRDKARAFNLAPHDLREGVATQQQALEFVCGAPHADHNDALGFDACRRQNFDGTLRACRRTPPPLRLSSAPPWSAHRCRAPQARRQGPLLPARRASRQAAPTAARTGYQEAGPWAGVSK